jgi:hypothetical protein
MITEDTHTTIEIMHMTVHVLSARLWSWKRMSMYVRNHHGAAKYVETRRRSNTPTCVMEEEL